MMAIARGQGTRDNLIGRHDGIVREGGTRCVEAQVQMLLLLLLLWGRVISGQRIVML